MPAPHQFHTRWWEGTGLSIAGHSIVLGLLLYAATHVPRVVQTASDVSAHLKVVFLNRSGTGGRDGGPASVDPPSKPRIASLKPIEFTPVVSPADTPPVPDTNIPVTTPQAMQTLPGGASQIDITSLGNGSGADGSGGRGSGGGPDQGPGFGPGREGAYGGDGFRAGNGVTSPQLIKEVRPNYTGDAMRAKVQGFVEMDAIVLADGSVDPNRLRITRSLDSAFGLDLQAIAAVKQWRFRPGTYKGQAVPMHVIVELRFTLR
jgi:protein TonB